MKRNTPIANTNPALYDHCVVLRGGPAHRFEACGSDVIIHTVAHRLSVDTDQAIRTLLDCLEGDLGRKAARKIGNKLSVVIMNVMDREFVSSLVKSAKHSKEPKRGDICVSEDLAPLDLAD